MFEDNLFNLSEFNDDYKYFFPLDIKVVNEETICYFDLNIIEKHHKCNEDFDPLAYINEKIKYEKGNIFKFLTMVTLICCEVMFDRYENVVDENMFLAYLDRSVTFIENELQKYLEAYYFQGVKPKKTVKSIDQLLFYVLTQFEDNIKNKKTIVSNPNELIDFLVDTEITWTTEEILDNEGAVKANKILKQNINYSDYSDIQSLIAGKLDEFSSMRKDLTMSPLEREYMLLLLNNTLINAAKINKNDFSDYLIITSCDLIKEQINEELIFVSFDDKLRAFIKENNMYYNEELYTNLYTVSS